MAKLVSRLAMSLGAVCVAALAASSVVVTTTSSARAGGGEHAVPIEAGAAAVDLAGRWSGMRYEMTRSRACEEGDACRTLTLDISRCGAGWCGVEVMEKGTCGGTALRMDAGAAPQGANGTSFKGELRLAKGTEPYTVEAYLAAGGDAGAAALEITGDTGGEFRVFRRTFPFHTSLVRAGELHCLPEKSVSMLP